MSVCWRLPYVCAQSNKHSISWVTQENPDWKPCWSQDIISLSLSLMWIQRASSTRRSMSFITWLVRETGRQLLLFIREPFLCNGVILASLQTWGKHEFLNEYLKMSESGTSKFCTSLRAFTWIQSTPHALLALRLDSFCLTASGVMSKSTILASMRKFVCAREESLLSYRTSTEAKKSLRIEALRWSSVIYFPSWISVSTVEDEVFQILSFKI